MSRTPKPERTYRKAEQAEGRWASRSHANLGAENHPAHRKHAEAFDRMNGPALTGFNRAWERRARRELAANGWPTGRVPSRRVVGAHALASLDRRWNRAGEEQSR